MDDCAALEKTLSIAKALLADLEMRKAGYGILSTPSELTLEFNAKQQEVESLKERLKAAKLAAKQEAQQIAQAEISYPSRMRSRVPDKHYIERDQAKRLLERFAVALTQPQEHSLLFNIYGIGGVGKTTLLGRLQEAHASEVDFLRVCFTKTPDIETPLKLMRKLHQQAMELAGIETSADSFTQRDQQLSGAENFFQSISSKCTTSSSHVFPLIFCLFSIRNLIENNEFTGFQEFSAPLRISSLKQLSSS